MKDTNKIDVLEEVTCFNLMISLWSGRKKLHKGDLKLKDGSEVPPADMASIGSFKLVDQKSLNDFNRIKKRMHSTLESVGVRFLGGSVYAVPNRKVDEVRVKLDDLVAESNIIKDAFLSEYHSHTEAWISKHSEWEHLIRKAITPKDIVASKIGFAFSCFSINPAANGVGEKELGQEVDGLTGQLYREIAQSADQLFEKSIAGKTEASQKIKGAIMKLREKMSGLAFLDKRIKTLLTSIDDTISALPKAGPIKDQNLVNLTALVLLMSSPDKMISHGSGLMPLNPKIESARENVIEVPYSVVVAPQPQLNQFQAPTSPVVGNHQGIPLAVPADMFG